VELVDASCAFGLLGHEPGLLEESEMAGDGRAADRHRPGELGDGLVALAEQTEDLPAVRVAERVEGIAAGPAACFGHALTHPDPCGFRA